MINQGVIDIGWLRMKSEGQLDIKLCNSNKLGRKKL